MALYSKWQNEKLYGICDGLSDEERHQDRGMFFGSIHRSLDHILMVDRVLWDFTVSGQPPRDWDPNRKVTEDYETLRAARFHFDAHAARNLAHAAEGLAGRDGALPPSAPRPRRASIPASFR